jgi:hypothetical protein
MEVRYLNTDLEIESKSDLSQIVEEFGDEVVVLYHGEMRGYQHASFEIAGSAITISPDDIVNSFCVLVEELSKEAREIWDGCNSRVFDIGYESGTTPQNYRSEIRGGTIQRVAKIGASIVITIYPLLTDSALPQKS